MRKWKVVLITSLIILLGFTVIIPFIQFDYAFVPDEDVRVNDKQSQGIQGFRAEDEESNISVNQVELGRDMFFKETFGNEVFFTDVLGTFNGPFTIANIGKAILKLNGEGTSNLQVEAAEDYEVGDVSFKKGELIDTGLDVAKGSLTPLGVNISMSEGRVRAGITCAVCHATVDRDGQVISGVPNNDLNVGLALAMGTNTAAYFTHTELEVELLENFVRDNTRTIETEDGKRLALPDPEQLEEFVDKEILKWPPGSNDPTINLSNNPVQFPDTFTLGDHPYGWGGQGLIGPFKGLSAAINNAHAQNMDAVSQAEIAKNVLDIDKELYLAIMLQNAAHEKLKYDPFSGEKPSDFFTRIDPTPGVPGVIELIKSATYPDISFLSSTGLLTSSPGFRAWEQVNAMSAYMNQLSPPKTGLPKEEETFLEGERVFNEAGCSSCHGGRYFTNNILIPADEIGTNPSRASGFSASEKQFSDTPLSYTEDTPVPLPSNPKRVEVDMTEEERAQLELGWAHNESGGGYKTKGLFGLYWSAPYLHDGGVAAGPNGELGVPETVLSGITPDPYYSLQALLDSHLRKKVVEKNLSMEMLRTANVTGEGHDFYVDTTTGFSEEEREAIIHYLLRLTDD
ncbi:electron transport protein [Evansella sp. AB-rgal1]|uniref:electron transport protein n=1 Tax=Evansella sp. AB-rgal1 TaxID=3242696 RepID=UPI00359D1CEE